MCFNFNYENKKDDEINNKIVCLYKTNHLLSKVLWKYMVRSLKHHLRGCIAQFSIKIKSKRNNIK